MPSQSPDKQGRYMISNQDPPIPIRLYHSCHRSSRQTEMLSVRISDLRFKDMTLLPCHRSSQTNQRCYRHLESADSPIPRHDLSLCILKLSPDKQRCIIWISKS
ncbi:hypothetical protein AVEN_25308-1 [Araneus ventricosus]|uniref:Uncharacterized protein n=1 Tax=Araneus ventricosus TaxID=182803 RepID=A0A4Y2IRC4_ARAVE|nr:hypothetical protein AVEN_25308-1 [Araneus ventricosus]